MTGYIAGFMKNHAGLGYVGSKIASTQLCKWKATVFAPYGVRVNSFTKACSSAKLPPICGAVGR